MKAMEAARRRGHSRNLREPYGDEEIADLERATFGYFDQYTNHELGLVRDSTKKDAPATIAGSGLALTCYPVAAERGYIARDELARRARAMLEFFWAAEQSDSPLATGYRGFFYHFLDIDT